MIQRGGYSEDPLGIWKLDDVAKEHGMEQWVSIATPDKEQADRELFRSFQDPEAQLMSRMKQWDIAIDPAWMKEHEDREIVDKRIAMRPTSFSKL